MARRKPFKPINPDAGPWMIWSHHWSRWHRRSSDGGAAGYTDDITQAGIFDFEKAREYHDPPPYRRDEAVPVSRAFDQLDAALAAKTAERDALAEKIADAKRRAAANTPASRVASSPQTVDAASGMPPTPSQERDQ